MSYKGVDLTAEIYVNSYGLQSPGHELVFHANSAAPPEIWTRVSWLKTDAPLQMGVFSSSFDQRWVIAQTYVVGGRVTSSGALAQFLYGWSALWRPDASGAVAIAAPCADDCTRSAALIEKFWSDNGSSLVSAIPSSSR